MSQQAFVAANRPPARDVRQALGAARAPIWRADGRAFHPTEVAATRHSLCDHPLLQLPKLRELAESFAGTSHIKYAMPNRKKGSAFYTLSESEAKKDIRSTFDRIDTPGTWAAIYFAEKHKDYGALIRETLDAMKPVIEPVDPGMHGYSLFLFIASPPTVTPFHIDRENNFNVQILGRKHLRVWPAGDRLTVPDQAIEAYFVDDTLRKLHYREEFESRALDYDVGPGEGVYIPSTAAHCVTTEDGGWATPGNAVSISLALTYFTAATRRRAYAYLFNQFARRRFAAYPASPGCSDALDRIKFPLGRLLALYRRTVHHKPIPRGM